MSHRHDLTLATKLVLVLPVVKQTKHVTICKIKISEFQ